MVVAAGRIETKSAPWCAVVPSDIEEIDATGRTLLPGLVDAHAHPLIAGSEAAGLSVRGCRSVSEVVDRVGAYAAAHPAQGYLIGEGFELSIADGGRFYAAELDAVVRDRPVALRSNDIHTYWANSAALRQAGIEAQTPDPIDGVIERFGDGTPTGTLREWGAFQALRASFPASAVSERAEQLLAGLSDLARWGITSALDAWVDPVDVDAYVVAAEKGLPLRLDIALRAEPSRWRDQLAEFARIRARLASLPDSARLTATTVKFFADGIIEGGTAAVHEPYTGSSCCGLPNWPSEELASAVQAFDAVGFGIHIHAIGDAAVSSALDAIEAVPGGTKHGAAIAHAQLVAERDRVRFARTGTTAVMQPYWAKLDDTIVRLTLGRLADGRDLAQYPVRSLLATGAPVAFSSDYPISTGDPLAGVAVAMTRNEIGDPSGAWMPDELLTREQALAAYTVGAAGITRSASGDGRLEVGAIADLTLVDTDLRTASPAVLLSEPARTTWLAGERPFIVA